METDDVRGRPVCRREDAVAVLNRLRSAGHIAYFAGGCVRDLLLKLEPKDFDVATDAPPQRVRELFARTQSVGASFGVILVRHGPSMIEVATFRTDGEYQDGRHPASIQFATAEQDARRRDFTINGLFLDPINDEVVDYVGGQADLQNRLLRAIGDPLARLAEDHLRMLRAVRFASRFDLDIEPATATALQKETSKLKRITPERIADELRLMLTPPTRISAWMLLQRFGLLAEIFRHLANPASESSSQDDGRSIFLNLSSGFPVPFATALLVAAVSFLFANQAADDVRSLLTTTAMNHLIRVLRADLKISNAESDAISETAAGLMMILGQQPPTLAQRKRFLALPTSRQSVELLRAIAGAGQHRERAAAEEAALQPLIGTDVEPHPFITGDDLKALGLMPGPSFKKILEAVYDAQLEARVVDRATAVELAGKLSAELTR